MIFTRSSQFSKVYKVSFSLFSLFKGTEERWTPLMTWTSHCIRRSQPTMLPFSLPIITRFASKLSFRFLSPVATSQSTIVTGNYETEERIPTLEIRRMERGPTGSRERNDWFKYVSFTRYDGFIYSYSSDSVLTSWETKWNKLLSSQSSI